MRVGTKKTKRCKGCDTRGGYRRDGRETADRTKGYCNNCKCLNHRRLLLGLPPVVYVPPGSGPAVPPCVRCRTTKDHVDKTVGVRVRIDGLCLTCLGLAVERDAKALRLAEALERRHAAMEGPQRYDPTPEQIEAGREELWPEKERAARARMARAARLSPKVHRIVIDEGSMACV